MKLRRDVFRPVVPTPAALITCAAPGARPNIISLGEVYMLALDPLVVGIGIRPSRYSHGLIAESREYVVNFPTAELVAAIDYCGRVSGADVDKFEATGLTPDPADVVAAPLIRECPINLECRIYTRVVPPHTLLTPEHRRRPVGEQHTIYFSEVLGTYSWEE